MSDVIYVGPLLINKELLTCYNYGNKMASLVIYQWVPKSQIDESMNDSFNLYFKIRSEPMIKCSSLANYHDAIVVNWLATCRRQKFQCDADRSAFRRRSTQSINVIYTSTSIRLENNRENNSKTRTMIRKRSLEYLRCDHTVFAIHLNTRWIRIRSPIFSPSSGGFFIT